MGRVTIYQETQATTVLGFPQLLWEALVRIGCPARPDYVVYQEEEAPGKEMFWALVGVPRVRGLGRRTFYFTGSDASCPDRALQFVAYKALTQLRHKLEDMKHQRATRYIPQYPIGSSTREYIEPNNEDDPALATLARFTRAQDTMTKGYLEELLQVQIELHKTREELSLVREQLQQSVGQKRSLDSMDSPGPAAKKGTTATTPTPRLPVLEVIDEESDEDSDESEDSTSD
jgi:hypothetical protein